MTKQKSRGNHRILAVVLAAALMLATATMFPTGGTTAAAASLPYIEKLKTQLEGSDGRAFRILEVVADENSPTGIGYYIAGYEPGRIAEDEDLQSQSTRADRENYAATVWEEEAKIDLAGLHGNDTTQYPFNIVPYEETYWWENAGAYPYELLLASNETANAVQGTITPQANGAYRAEMTYVIGASGTGTHALAGGYLQYAGAASTDGTVHFYYELPNFELLTPYDDNFADGTPIPAGAPIYRLEDDAFHFYAYNTPGALGSSGDFYAVNGFDAPDTTDFGVLTTTLGVSGPYVRVNTNVVEDSSGYLTRSIGGLTLVQTGGDYSFAPNNTGEEYDITYDVVRYRGGFANNNWFSRFVLDVPEAQAGSISYQIKTNEDSDLTGFDADSYDMVVIDAGVTLPIDFVDKIKAKSGTLPVLIIDGNDTIAAQFEQTAMWNSYEEHGFVSGSLYFYSSVGARGDLLTKDFQAAITGAPGAGFTEVAAVIKSENDLRAITGEEPLPTVVSVATSIRHILNQRAPRVVQPLSHVRVLEIQPLRVEGHEETDYLTKSEVKTWLSGLQIIQENGNLTDVDEDDITITTMSTAEFNGKIEDLNENYELIYIGDSRAIFANYTKHPLTGANSDEPSFYDNNLDGLLYYNIGDKITKSEAPFHAATKAAGLLDSDWTDVNNKTTIDSSSPTATNFRLPGNDISLAKKKALEDFANAGYPIIFADDLVTAKTDMDDFKDVAYAVALGASNDKTLTAVVTYDNAGAPYATITDLLDDIGYTGATISGTFEWHWIAENGTDRVIKTTSGTPNTDTYTVNVNENNPGEYYCLYRLVRGSDLLGTAARSNSAAVMREAYYLQVSGLPEKTATAQVTYSYSGAASIAVQPNALTATVPGTVGAAATIVASIPQDTHKALLVAYPNLQYTYELQQSADNGTSWAKIAAGDVVGAAVITGKSNSVTFRLNPKTSHRYRVQITLTPTTGTSEILTPGSDYSYVNFDSLSFAQSGTVGTNDTTKTYSHYIVAHNFPNSTNTKYGKTLNPGVICRNFNGSANTIQMDITVASSMLSGDGFPPGSTVQYTLYKSSSGSSANLNQLTQVATFDAGSNHLLYTYTPANTSTCFRVKAELTYEYPSGVINKSISYTSFFRYSGSGHEMSMGSTYNGGDSIVIGPDGNEITTDSTYTLGGIYTAPTLTPGAITPKGSGTYDIPLTVTQSDGKAYSYTLWEKRLTSDTWRLVVPQPTLAAGATNTVTLEGGKTYRIEAIPSADPTVTVRTQEITISAAVTGTNPTTSFAPTAGGSTQARVELTTKATPLHQTTEGITIDAAIAVEDAAGNALSGVFTSTYQWFKADNETEAGTAVGANAASYKATTPGYYYCVVTLISGANTAEVASKRILVTGSSQGFQIETVTGLPRRGAISSYEPNSVRIDKWTNLSAFMVEALKRENVFAQGEIASPARQDSLRSFIALSKPAILFETGGYPTPYEIDAGGNMNANTTGRQLRYEFTISDPADPTPASTTYNVHLYIDANASGLYTNDEAINIDVYEAATNKLLVPGSGRMYALRAGTQYMLEARLPTDMVGIVPWKLEVVKNAAGGRSATYFHGSEIGYTRISTEEGQEKQIKVLQIVGRDPYHTDYTDDGLTVILETNEIYKRYIDPDKLKDFDIRLSTIRADGSFYQYRDAADQPQGPVYVPQSADDSEERLWDASPTGTATAAEIYQRINYYDMLVIGFADCFEGVEEPLAQAIAQYIESGKAVLFTHDTASFLNVPKDTQRTGNSLPSYAGNNLTKNSYWGYYVNKVLRTRLGIDNYGIMDQNADGSLSDLAIELRKGNPLAANAKYINDLKAAGYNIAYKPNGDGQTVVETHGYGAYFLHTDDPNYRPKKVTQTNAGQITTYPYNINLEGFQGAPDDAHDFLEVAPTHFQYYALNMNEEDLVVWYCLADDAVPSQITPYYYHTNDAASGYYIYTMGNITYSGVGHDNQVTDEEAMLFVNTMIAAYRSTSLNSEVSIRDQNNNKINYVYFPADIADGDSAQDEMLVTTQENNEMYAVYFSFVDANIKGGSSGTSYARYYYSIGSENKFAQTGGVVSMEDLGTYLGTNEVSSIERSNLYHFYLPPDVVKKLADTTSVRVYIEVVTYFDNGSVGKGYDSVELRKIGLLALE